MASLFRYSRKPAPLRPCARARLAVEPLEERTVPTPFTVSNLNDAGPGSLRQAIVSANVAPGADVIVFQPGLAGTIPLATGVLHIRDSVTITGPGAGVVTISGNNASQIFLVDNAATSVIGVAISGLTVTQGNAGSALEGGGIQVANENLTLSNVVVAGNTAVIGGGILIGVGGQLTLDGSAVSNNNSINAVGGGLFLGENSVSVIRNSTIAGNQANGPGRGGGGIFVDVAASLTLTNSTVAANQALGGDPIIGDSAGGGILVWTNATLVARNSTISGNDAPFGGGIYVDTGGSVTLEDSTLSGNSAGSAGGGIWMRGNVLAIRNSTIAFNSADSHNAGGTGGGIFITFGQLTLESSIVADNAVGAAGQHPDISGGLVATNSLVENIAGAIFSSASTANILGLDPLLGPLANNGGPTKTHTLLPGSPAIDHGANLTGLAADQRGGLFLRTFGGGTDIGAFEVQPNPGPTQQAIQAAVQVIRILQPTGGRLAAATIGDVSGDFINDIVLAFRLRNNKLLIATLSGIDGKILGVFQPFSAPLRAGAKARLVMLSLVGDAALEIGLIVTPGGAGVPSVSVFTMAGKRVL
jgi:hypothetical protein